MCFWVVLQLVFLVLSYIVCEFSQLTSDLYISLTGIPGSPYLILGLINIIADLFFCRSEEHLPTYCRSDVVQFTVSDRLIVGFPKLIFFHRFALILRLNCLTRDSQK